WLFVQSAYHRGSAATAAALPPASGPASFSKASPPLVESGCRSRWCATRRFDPRVDLGPPRQPARLPRARVVRRSVLVLHLNRRIGGGVRQSGTFSKCMQENSRCGVDLSRAERGRGAREPAGSGETAATGGSRAPAAQRGTTPLRAGAPTVTSRRAATRGPCERVPKV